MRAANAGRGCVMLVFYVYAVVLLGILIIVHEVGHFLAARASGVTVERFSIGFGPRILSVKRGATEYALSLVPLGGYVKMTGAELAGEGADLPPDPGAFLSKRIGLRAIIVGAGPVTNFVWAVLLYIGVLWAGGIPVLDKGSTVGYVEEGSPAEAAGLAVGDRILAVEGTPVDTWEAMRRGIAEARTEDGIDLLVRRGKEDRREFHVVVSAAPDSSTGGVRIGIGAYIPPLVGDVMRGSPAARAGLVRGDSIVSIGGEPVRTWYELEEKIQASPGRALDIVWVAAGTEAMKRAVVVPDQTKESVAPDSVRVVGTIGTSVPAIMKKVGPGEAILAGLSVSLTTLRLIGDFFVQLFQGRVSPDMLGGPIRVVQLASESARWGASYFFGFMAYLSLNLFVVNLLPLPVLDGGHLLLLALEKIRRRRLTERQLLVWQQIGLAFFACLLVFLLVKDAISLR